MLHGKLQLHDIRDVEAFTAQIINHKHLTQEPCDREDLHAYLIATCWELSIIQPQPWKRSFSGWATPLLQLRITDWQRNRYGRTTWTFHNHTHTRPRPQPASLNDTDIPGTVDPQGDRSLDLIRLLRTRDSHPPTPNRPRTNSNNSLGQDPARAAA